MLCICVYVCIVYIMKCKVSFVCLLSMMRLNLWLNFKSVRLIVLKVFGCVNFCLRIIWRK